MRRLLERCDSRVSRVLGFYYALLGVDMLTSSSSAFGAPTHLFIFSVVSRPWWGLAFLLIGLAAATRTVLGAVLLAGLLVAWEGMILGAIISEGVHWGAALSTAAAIHLLLIAALRGTRSSG